MRFANHRWLVPLLRVLAAAEQFRGQVYFLGITDLEWFFGKRRLFTGPLYLAQDSSLRIPPGATKREEITQSVLASRAGFCETKDFADGLHTARAVAQPVQLHDDMHG